MQSSYLARSLVVAALTAGASRAAAQGVATAQRDASPPYQRTHSIGTPVAPDAAAVTIAARRDGWVEIAVRPTARGGARAPWLVVNGRIVAAEAHGRGYFAPAEVQRAAALADTLLARPLHPDSSRAYARFASGPPRLAALRDAAARGGRSLLDWFYFPPELDRRTGAPRGVVEMGVGPCQEDARYGRAAFAASETSLEEFRQMVASLQSAAAQAREFAPTPRPEVRDLLDADETACEAAPRRVPAPEFPRTLARAAVVHLDAVIDTSGAVEAGTVDVRVTPGTPTELVRAATDSLRRWRFSPALASLDRPVRQRVHVELRYSPSEVDLRAERADAGRHGADVVVIVRPDVQGALRLGLR